MYCICSIVYNSACFSSGRIIQARTPAVEDTQICREDTADEIMERIVRSATQGPSTRAQPRERRRSRANRKSCKSQILRRFTLNIAFGHILTLISSRCSEADTEKWFDPRRGSCIRISRFSGCSMTIHTFAC